MKEEQSQFPTDVELVTALTHSDEAAFDAIYRHYFDNLFRFIWRRTHDPELSQDLVQELFLRLWRNRKNLQPEKPLKPYLYRIASNLVTDSSRQAAARRPHLPLATDDSLPIQQVEEDALTADIRQAIESLPEILRHPFMLNRYEGLKYREIAELLGVSQKTIESRMSQALKLLHKKLASLLSAMLI